MEQFQSLILQKEIKSHFHKIATDKKSALITLHASVVLKKKWRMLTKSQLTWIKIMGNKIILSFWKSLSQIPVLLEESSFWLLTVLRQKNLKASQQKIHQAQMEIIKPFTVKLIPWYQRKALQFLKAIGCSVMIY